MENDIELTIDHSGRQAKIEPSEIDLRIEGEPFQEKPTDIEEPNVSAKEKDNESSPLIFKGQTVDYPLPTAKVSEMAPPPPPTIANDNPT